MKVLVFTALAQELWMGWQGHSTQTQQTVILHILSIILIQFVMFLTNYLHIAPLKYRFLVAWEKKKTFWLSDMCR